MYFIAFVKAYYRCAYTASKPPTLSVCLSFCFAQFTLLVYKSLIMVVENVKKIPLDLAYKYATRSHNKKVKQIIMNERSE